MQPAGDIPHQAVLDEVAKVFRKAEIRHLANIKQVAADAAKVAAAVFAEQLMTYLPTPAVTADSATPPATAAPAAQVAQLTALAPQSTAEWRKRRICAAIEGHVIHNPTACKG